MRFRRDRPIQDGGRSIAQINDANQRRLVSNGGWPGRSVIDKGSPDTPQQFGFGDYASLTVNLASISMFKFSTVPIPGNGM